MVNNADNHPSLFPPNTTVLTASTSFGDSLIRGFKGENGYFYDALGGGFRFDLDQLIDELDRDFSIKKVVSNDVKNLRKKSESNNINSQNYINILSSVKKDEFFSASVSIDAPSIPIQYFNKLTTNTNKNTKNDGKTVWTSFIRHSLSMLSSGGFLSMITPSIWMKPDKAGIYNLFTKCTSLKKVRCFTNTERNRLFHGEAQTPICYFLLKKEGPSSNIVFLYERNTDRYIPYPLLSPTHPLPVFGASLFIKLQPYVLAVGPPTVIKTSMPPKNTVLSPICTTATPYCNVRSCILSSNIPRLTYEYSQTPLAFHGTPKLILAHKMYGFPYYDASGTFGISRRDNYILQGLSREDFRKWHSFLSTKFALYLMEGTRYRMKYLEKYVFEMIPNITKLEDFPCIINDDTLAEYFQLTSIERNAIAKWSREYQFFSFDV